MSTDDLEILLAAIVLVLFVIAMLVLNVAAKLEIAREKAARDQSSKVYLEVLQEMYRKGIKHPYTHMEEMELLTLRDAWIKAHKLTLEEKTIAIRAGLNPKNAKKIIKKVGLDNLSAQAYLRCKP